MGCVEEFVNNTKFQNDWSSMTGRAIEKADDIKSVVLSVCNVNETDKNKPGNVIISYCCVKPMCNNLTIQFSKIQTPNGSNGSNSLIVNLVAVLLCFCHALIITILAY